MQQYKTPRVGILGRPNVGKSTLFNILTRSRKAVVRNEPGVTRDVNIEPAEWWGGKFDVVDTGGVTESQDQFSQLIKNQVSEAVQHVDLLVVVMDGRSGLVPEDRDIIRLAKQTGKPFFLVVNKVDKLQESELVLSEFYEFGIDVISCSFERRQGIEEIVEWILKNLPEESVNTQRNGVRISIIGKPNAGKSSLCNYLLKDDRMIVSDIAGTTVDSVAAEFEYNDQPYILMDTAGLRRASKRQHGIEKLSSFKSYEAIHRSDIVLLVVDALLGPSVQEAKMVEYILERHKPVIIVANKMDLAKEERPEFRKWFREQMQIKFHFFPDIPLAFISAKTGSGVKNMFSLVEEIWGKLNIKIKTSELNNFFFESIRQAPAPVYGSKNIKFYYITQTQQKPPSFIAFANHPEGVTPSYRRFLVKKMKERFSLEGIPIRIFCMESRKTGKSSKKLESAELVEEMHENEWIQSFIQEHELAEQEP